MLITHQRQFLPACDRLVVLRKGHIVAIGTWEEILMQHPDLVRGWRSRAWEYHYVSALYALGAGPMVICRAWITLP